MEDTNDPPIIFEPRVRFYFGKKDEHFIGAGFLRYPARHAHRHGIEKGHPDFRFLYLLEGGGMYGRPDGERIPIAPGDLVCRRPDIDHAILPEKNRLWREFYFVLPPFLYTMFQEADLIPKQDLSRIRCDASMRTAMETVIASVQHARSFAALLPDIADFMTFIKTRTDGAYMDKRERVMIAKAKRMLSSGVERTLSMETVARSVGMEYDAFRKRFKEITGMAPKEYRMRKKLAAAADMLLDGQMSVSAISEQLGYPDIFCFSRQFKSHFHCTPREYRRIYR
ncbi:MAG: helix-turn-helix transcriptional regulator [Spirochaetes bacterium]|nr:helix-turn-helix transcriptional regulator [Spirochaetota bacterium]